MAYSRPTISQYWPRSESTASIASVGLLPGQGGASKPNNRGMEGAAISTPGLTFTYTAADIQGLAEPTHSGGRSAMLPPVHTPVRDLSASRAGMPVSPYEAVDALMQQQKTGMSMSSSPTVPQAQQQQQPRIRGRMTPYAFFVMERREFYRRQGLPVQFAAFSKECSSIWKDMSEEQKQKYQKLAEEDRERYQREISGGYVKPLAKDGTRRGRKKKEPGQPKRNMCAFLHFCSAKRPKLKEENPSLGVGALAKQLSIAWKLMNDEQKQPYNEMAGRDKQRYEQQKQAYEAGYSAAYYQKDASGGATGPGMVTHMVPRQRRRRKDPDMPKRNMSAFMFYSLEKRPEVKLQNPSFGVGKLAQCLAQTWRHLTSEQREPFDLMAKKDKERYTVELKAYKKGLYSGGGRRSEDCKPMVISQEDADTRVAGLGTSSHELGDTDEESSPGLDQLCELYQ